MTQASTDTDDESTDFGFERVAAREKGRRVREVFDSVAARYDLMNDIMSLGIHRLWKRDFVAALDPRPNRSLLDLAAGTGDIGIGWRVHGGGHAILTDINESMLRVGRERAGKRGWAAALGFVVADAEALPLPDRCVDRVSMAFGLRNCTHKDRVLAEARRVLKPGGRFFCLEFSKLRIAAMESLYDRWSFGVLPEIGARIASDRDSYRYLAESIRMFPSQEKLGSMMGEAGFERVAWRNLSGGIAAIHSGWRL